MCLGKNVVGGEIVVATVEGMGGGMEREVWGSMGVWGGGMGAGYTVPNWFDTRKISVPKPVRYSQDFCPQTGSILAGCLSPNWFDTRRISVPKLVRYSQDFCGWRSIHICMYVMGSTTE